MSVLVSLFVLYDMMQRAVQLLEMICTMVYEDAPRRKSNVVAKVFIGNVIQDL